MKSAWRILGVSRDGPRRHQFCRRCAFELDTTRRRSERTWTSTGVSRFAKVNERRVKFIRCTRGVSQVAEVENLDLD